MLLDGRGQATGIKRRGADTSLLMVFNAYHDLVEFTLPPSYEAKGWNRLLDTADPQLAASQFDIGAIYEVTARSMLLFERVPQKMDRSRSLTLWGQRSGRWRQNARFVTEIRAKRAEMALLGALSWPTAPRRAGDGATLARGRRTSHMSRE